MKIDKKNKKNKKTSRINLRVYPTDLEFIDLLKVKPSQVWGFGLQYIFDNLDEFKQIVCANYAKNAHTINAVNSLRSTTLREIAEDYVCAKRSIEEPTDMDFGWIKSRTKGITGITPQGFLIICKNVESDLRNGRDNNYKREK